MNLLFLKINLLIIQLKVGTLLLKIWRMILLYGKHIRLNMLLHSFGYNKIYK